MLDVGAGVGFFSRRLLDQGAREAVCVDPAYEHEHDEVHAGRPIRFVHGVNSTAADTVLLMDVLEHGTTMSRCSAAMPRWRRSARGS
ncbi:MAG: class I SAM-dependent methyltransferase [Rhodospirillales bacterium]